MRHPSVIYHDVGVKDCKSKLNPTVIDEELLARSFFGDVPSL